MSRSDPLTHDGCHQSIPTKLEKDRFRRRLINDYSMLDTTDKQARHEDNICQCLHPSPDGSPACGQACINRVM